MGCNEYAFGPLIQKELDEFTWEWNHHRIRRSNMSEVPHGIPDVLYSVPSLNGKSFCDSPYNIIIVL